MFDLILRNVNAFGGKAGMDYGINDGTVAAVAAGLQGEARRVIDLCGRVMIPSFVDSHMHLDKAFMGEGVDVDGLLDAIRVSKESQRAVQRGFVAADVQRRARRVIEMELASGSGALKTHILADALWGMEAFEAQCDLKNEYRQQIDIYNLVPYCPDIDAEFRAAARAGRIDFIAGYPTVSPDYRATTDLVFALAEEYSLPLDLHVDEADAPNIDCFEYVLQKTIEYGMQGRVNCSHVTALCAVDDERAKRAIELCKKAEVNIITLPSCNMYLMGRHDRQPIRRGITRVDEFLKAGVNVAYASDNVRDPFHPFGNGDMLEEGLFAAKVLQYGTTAQLETVLRMGTYNAAKNSLIGGYGVDVGCRADFTVLDALTPKDALLSRSDKLLVLKAGRVVREKAGIL